MPRCSRERPSTAGVTSVEPPRYDGLRLDALELRRVELALASPVSTAVGAHVRRPVVYVRVVTDAGEGWGECGALAEGTVVDPPLDAVWSALAGRAGMGPRLIEAARHRSGQLVRAAQVAALGSGSGADRLAGAALEMAVLDAELRTEGRSLAERLGVERRRVDAGAVVGIPAGFQVTALLRDVEVARSRGYRRVRLKIAPGWDAVPVKAVRDAFPDLALQVDANGAYRARSDGPDSLDALRPSTAADSRASNSRSRRPTSPPSARRRRRSRRRWPSTSR